MKHIFLIAANFAAYLLFICKCFTLMEGMLYGKHYGMTFRLCIGIVNAALMVAMALHVPINLAYSFTVLLLFAELWSVFMRPLKDTVFVTVSVMMNIMCLRGMVISIFAIIANKTLHEVCGTPDLFLGALLASNILEWLSLFVIMHYISMEDLRFAMHNKTQSRYIIVWASLCVLFMFRSSGIYVRDYSVPFMFIDHFSYCFILLLSFYYILVYTMRLNRALKVREINKNLSIALGNKIQLQSALMRDALFTAQANLTQNKIISGLEVYCEPVENIPTEYDRWFEYVKSKIYPDDYDIFYKSLERRNLLSNYEMGIEPKPFEYRRFGADNFYHWVRLVLRMFKDVETGDVHLFGYAFDIEDEARNRQTLLRCAQTDLFTGLYNKVTTETIIGEEVRKGAGILLLLDIDNFKTVNDRFGHETGDHVLKRISELLTDTFRKCDVVGRIGGDEFMIFIRDTTDISIAEDRAAEILKRLRSGINCGGQRLFITVSIGIVVIDEKIDSFSLAYNRADSALYRAKHSGKNGYFIYDGNVKYSVC